jgi:hypothetical protein
MRSIVLCLIIASLARPACAEDWKLERPLAAPPQSATMTSRVMAIAEAYKPRWADEQKGVVGYRPRGSNAVYGLQFNHGVGVGLSIKF